MLQLKGIVTLDILLQLLNIDDAEVIVPDRVGKLTVCKAWQVENNEPRLIELVEYIVPNLTLCNKEQEANIFCILPKVNTGITISIRLVQLPNIFDATIDVMLAAFAHVAGKMQLSNALQPKNILPNVMVFPVVNNVKNLNDFKLEQLPNALK